MFGLYGGLARRAPHRKRFFFDGAGGRFRLSRPDFLAFCLPCPVSRALHCVPLHPCLPCFACHLPCACVLCACVRPCLPVKNVSLRTQSTFKQGFVPCSFIVRLNFVQ